MGLIRSVLRSRLGEVHAVALGVLVAGVVGLMIDVMTIFTGGAASPYYAGVNLVMVAVALLMPWPPLVALFTCTVLVGCYVVCTLATQRIADLRPFVSNLFFLTTTGTITVVSTLVREHLRRREFSHRMALVEAARHKSDFMARMSHELRTPIHVMIGYADILLEEALDAGGRHARELVQHIRSHGGVRIEARLGGVECLAGFTFIDDAAHRWRASDARRVLVFVRDSGIGIRQADVATLAADFQQVDPEAAARYGGTGLGLSISKKLVQLLGGRIAVRSRYREGSDFVVCLPVRGAAAVRGAPVVDAPVRVPNAA